MNKINWREKLSSRKLWMAVAGFVTGVVLLIQGGGDLSGTVLAFGSVVGYLLGQGIADAKEAGNQSYSIRTGYVFTEDDEEDGDRDG